MDITRFGHANFSETRVATLVALSVFCGLSLAQTEYVSSQPASMLPNAESSSQPQPAESSDLPALSLTADEAEYPAPDAMTRQRLRPFGAGSNGSPRFTRSDVEVAPWRGLAGLQAAGGYGAEVSEISSRWWFSTGRTDVGLGVGSVTLTGKPMGGAMAAADTAAAGIALASSPSLTVGLRRRTSATSTVYADATGSRSIGIGGMSSYSGKVGVEWNLAESRWSVAYSGLGLRLNSESRMTVNLRKGGLGIYMRSKF